MYNPTEQNILLKIKEDINQCSYEPIKRDYVSNLVISVLNYPKKSQQARHFIKNMLNDKIIMVWLPMNIPFYGKNYTVPLQIYIMKYVPHEPQQIFLEVVKGTEVNRKNKNIDPKTNTVMCNTLKKWSQYSLIDNALNEIFASFSNTFPIYKKGLKQPPIVEGGGIYGNLVGEVKNLYQQNANNNTNYNNQNKGNNYGYQPPQKNIYGKAINNNNYNNYNNQTPNSFGGGVYDKPKKDPKVELKEILINEVTLKIKDKLISEKKRLNFQNDKMIKYKALLTKENNNLINFVKGQNLIRKKCDEDMAYMSKALERIKVQINQRKKNVLSENNCLDFIEIPDPYPIKAIASETTLEEMILIVRRAFERKKISFNDAIMFVRNSSRNIFSLKFLKSKSINKYKK